MRLRALAPAVLLLAFTLSTPVVHALSVSDPPRLLAAGGTGYPDWGIIGVFTTHGGAAATYATDLDDAPGAAHAQIVVTACAWMGGGVLDGCVRHEVLV